MQLVVFEDTGYQNLLPLVYTRAAFDLRCGSDTLLDKIETAIGGAADALCVRPTIAGVIAERQPRPVNTPPGGDDQLWVNGRLLLRRKLDLPLNAAAWEGDTLLAARLDAKTASALQSDVLHQPGRLQSVLSQCHAVQIPAETALLIEYPWDLIQENQAEIVRQLERARPKIEGQVYPGACLINESDVHVGAGAKIKSGAVLDAEDGPIHIGADTTVGPNANITGPCCIADGCIIRPGASIRGGTSLGPASRVGGEVVCTIFQGFSNKQHDGFLGHAYLGQWVNLGADTVNSNLKNTYGSIKVPINGRPIDSGLTFAGAFIGDHAKTGINVTLPTGCVIGFASNLIVSSTAPKFVPSFSWLTDEGRQANDPARALQVARKVLARRHQTLCEAEAALFLSVLEEARRLEADR